MYVVNKSEFNGNDLCFKDLCLKNIKHLFPISGKMDEKMEIEVNPLIAEENSNYNPWSVSDLDVFLYFCCPECDVKDHSKEEFIKHAFTEHPKSKECLQMFHIKKEIEEYDENIDKYEDENSFQYFDPEFEMKKEVDEDFHQNPLKYENENDSYMKKEDSEILLNSEEVISHPCEFCDKNFTVMSNLRRHVRKFHKMNDKDTIEQIKGYIEFTL